MTEENVYGYYKDGELCPANCNIHNKNKDQICDYCRCDCKFCRNVRLVLSYEDFVYVKNYVNSVFGH